jgi:hypothetical protein
MVLRSNASGEILPKTARIANKNLKKSRSARKEEGLSP